MIVWSTNKTSEMKLLDEIESNNAVLRSSVRATSTTTIEHEDANGHECLQWSGEAHTGMSMVVCCSPRGVVPLEKSCRREEKRSLGDERRHRGEQEKSQWKRKWPWCSWTSSRQTNDFTLAKSLPNDSFVAIRTHSTLHLSTQWEGVYSNSKCSSSKILYHHLLQSTRLFKYSTTLCRDALTWILCPLNEAKKGKSEIDRGRKLGPNDSYVRHPAGGDKYLQAVRQSVDLAKLN